ncbi:MAG: hypothetical protein AB7P69_19040 [Candidatus Binatia bacterium]
MPLWMPKLETQLYRFLARLAAGRLAKGAPILSVYARRSVACGEVVFGHSDIDLHLLVEPFTSIDQEAQVLRDLAIRHAQLKRLLPCVGDCNVSTRAELASWYRERPYTWYRDRAWLKLYGEDWNRPEVNLRDEAVRDSLLWWFFWAWERLPRFFRAGNVRICGNLFLDMVNVYGLYTGALKTSTTRRAALQYWRTFCPPSRELEAFVNGLATGFRGWDRPPLRWLYRESLRLGDALAERVARTLEGKGCAAEAQSNVPFDFSVRVYLLVDSEREEQTMQALDAMQRKAHVFVTTEKTLKLYLYHRNPWEYYALRANHSQFPLCLPPTETLHQSVRYALHKEVPRSAGFSIGRRVNRGVTVGFQYAQYRLYAEHGRVATSAAELRRQYQHHYGVWPYVDVSSRDDFFLRNYPVTCEIIEDLQKRVLSREASWP